MEDATRKCPYCAEVIPAEAVRCRYCRSRLTTLDPERWHRDHPERRIAGVAAALGRALAVPAGVVRVGFIVSTFFHLLGPLVYGALWLVIPYAPGEESALERTLGWAQDQVAQFRGGRHGPSGRRAGGTRAGDAASPGTDAPAVPGEPHPW
jgi:phage shock protein PspC (stress-responsive transcriptional regulator)